jgi:hypothetical protein
MKQAKMLEEMGTVALVSLLKAEMSLKLTILIT